MFEEGKMEGLIRWFSSKRGYGFIEQQGKEDIFFHYSGIDMEGYKTIEKGQKVSFNIKESDKGPIAIDIETLE